MKMEEGCPVLEVLTVLICVREVIPEVTLERYL